MGHKVKQSSVNSRVDFFYYAFRNILLASIPLVIISALILGLTTPHSSADITTVDSVSFDLQVSCTIISSVTSEHRAEINGGQHKTEVGETKVSTYCNDNNGYNIYAIGSSNNTDGNTDLVVNGLSSDYNIKTGIYSSGSTISSWGMKLTAGTGAGAGGAEVTPPTINNGFNNYNIVPSVYTLVASRPSGTNMDMDADPDVTGSYFTTTYDIYASSVQPAGSYEGKVKYIMTHPNTNAPSTINDIDAAFALAGKQKVYQDSEGSYYAMQDMDSNICSSVINTGESTTARLVDMRDKNLYYVTKEKDGNCWMTQNLDLDINGPNTSSLTSENTDISTTASGSGIYSTTYGYSENNDVWIWNPGTTTGDVIVDYDSNKTEGWANSNTVPYSAEGGDTYFYTSNTTTNDTRYDSLDLCKADHSEADCLHYHVGNYYNWTAAVASNNSNGFSTQYANAANSICPKGWRLPIATNSDQSIYEFGDMLFKQGIATQAVGNPVSYAANGFKNIRKSPLWFVRSGYLDNNINNLASYGYYLSSTVISNNGVYSFYFGSNNIYISNNDYYNYYYSRARGMSIRCLAR